LVTDFPTRRVQYCKSVGNTLPIPVYFAHVLLLGSFMS